MIYLLGVAGWAKKKNELNQSICWPSGRRRDRERREVTRPKEREDGWMEAELGDLYNESCCNDISVSFVDQTWFDHSRN